jgi:transposase-like protein
MMQEHGVDVDPSTIFRWVQRYAPELEKRVRWYQGYRSGSWRVDETYVRVGGQWKGSGANTNSPVLQTPHVVFDFAVRRYI